MDDEHRFWQRSSAPAGPAEPVDPAGGADAARHHVDAEQTPSGQSGPALRLPSPPPDQRSTYPSIPAGPQGDDRRRSPGRGATVALLAALLGALVGTAGSVLFLDSRAGEEAGQVATPVTVTQPQQRPTIEVQGGEGLDRVAAVAETVLPSVVRVDIRGGDALGASGNGSGVVYRSDGHIITNNHVVASAGQLEVLLNDGSRAAADVVGTDPRNDLAVIKVDRTGLPAIRIGDSSALKVGELAVAVGSPFGLDGTVTAGVISALNRPITVNDPAHGSQNLPNVVQTDASINPGNSGGALVNGEGELIGISSAILTRGFPGQAANAGVGFAVPSATAVLVADQLIAEGEVRYAFLGVAGINVSRDVAERTGVERGAYIERVEPGTAAEEAGLQEGDVIIGLDNDEIDSMESLMLEIMRRDIGDTVSVTYVRDGERREAEAVLTERPQ